MEQFILRHTFYPDTLWQRYSIDYENEIYRSLLTVHCAPDTYSIKVDTEEKRDKTLQIVQTQFRLGREPLADLLPPDVR